MNLFGRELQRSALVVPILTIAAALWAFVPLDVPQASTAPDDALLEQRERLFANMVTGLELSPAQMTRVRAIFAASPILGQGNPRLTEHLLSWEQCRLRRAQAKQLAAPDARCGAVNMVVARGPEGAPERVCIDQYEFPNIPCDYPVVHVTAREAALLCEVVGKRLCDAHEWEGACAGALLPAAQQYAWGRSRSEMTGLHNASRERVWAYGSSKDHEKCATGSFKTPGCKGGYRGCGSNTYPCGSFPACVSPFGVYDQHGNVAEHMNLPLAPDQLARGQRYGVTEMKGSWFIFASHEAHEDDCRWRAPDWHASRVLDPASHSNYHLGFRCCRDLPPE